MTGLQAVAHDGPVAALILGASEYPLTSLKGTPAFCKSARAFKDYVVSLDGLAVGDRLLDLFDSTDNVLGQNKAITAFLKQQHESAATLIVYYVGHGGFLPDKEYFLALQSTEKDSEYLTGLRIKAFAHTLDNHFSDKRIILILDCCFAGEAVDEFQGSELADVLDRQTCEAMPARGTSLLVASSKDRPAIAPTGREFTMFSECLIEVLTNGAAIEKPVLTLYDVGDAVQKLIRNRFKQAGVRPEVHSPRQDEGDPAKEEIFPNRAYRPPAHPDLPREIEEALASLSPGVRRDAVDSLAQLAKIKGSALAGVAADRLRQLAETDDSRSVRELAAKHLAELPPHLSEQPVKPAPEPQPITFDGKPSYVSSVKLEPVPPKQAPPQQGDYVDTAKFASAPLALSLPEPGRPLTRTSVPRLSLQGYVGFMAVGLALGLIGYSVGAALWPKFEPEVLDWSWQWEFWNMAAPGISAAFCLVGFIFSARWKAWQSFCLYFFTSAILRLPFEGIIHSIRADSFEYYLEYYMPYRPITASAFSGLWLIGDSLFFALVSTYLVRRNFRRRAETRLA